MAALLSSLCLFSAKANLILKLDNVYGYEGQEGAPADLNPSATVLSEWLIGSTGLKDLYKGETGGEVINLDLSGSYETSFSSGNETATITYTGGEIPGGYVFALAKDGASHHPVWYVWYLSGPALSGGTSLGWDGVTALEFAQLWADAGAISHVQLMGTDTRIPPSVVVVPDGGATAALLGLGMLGLGLVTRRKV